MAVTFHITAALQAFAGGRERIEIDTTSGTLGDALDALWKVCPGLRDRVATEQGAIREHVNVFIGPENVKFTGGLTTPVTDGAEVSIFHAVSGGR